MKKVISLLAAMAICGACVFGTVACGDDDKSGQKHEVYSVYAPDGAPALSLVNAISQNTEDFDYHVIDSSLIQAKVTGRDPEADFCILPLNLASKLLGSGETYQMLGTVTNGNLYFLTTDGASITSDNIQTTLIGKTVGVVQLTNVPGLTLQVVLKDYGYQIIESLQAKIAEDKVNLLAMDVSNVSPASGCDYYLCPEPAATTKCKATKGALKMAGDLQEIYGEGGYPQAVLMVKKTVIAKEQSAVDKLIFYMENSEEYLKAVQPETVLNLLDGKRTQGLTPSFDANNLNEEVIRNCSVWFNSAQTAKTSVNLFLEKLIAVNPSSASTVSDQFFYTEVQ